MLWIEDKTIIIHRGDEGIINFRAKKKDGTYYEFQEGDVLKFQVMERCGYDKNVVFEKIIEVTESTEEVQIELTATDTTIGEAGNGSTEYWYEISLNDTLTIIGFDKETGPTKFRLLPAREV